mgnify:CR=1 FL=1
MVDPKRINEFKEQVQWLHEPEFGDFKRKVALYIDRLAKDIGAPQNPTLRSQIEEMKKVVIYSPSGDMEKTRTKTLELAERMK